MLRVANVQDSAIALRHHQLHYAIIKNSDPKLPNPPLDQNANFRKCRDSLSFAI